MIAPDARLRIDLRLYLMCIYNLVLFKQLAEAW